MGGGFGGGLVPSKFNVSVSYSDKKPNVGKPVRHSDKASVVFGKYVKPEKWDLFNILKFLYFISFLVFHLREKEINGLLGTKNWNKIKNVQCELRLRYEGRVLQPIKHMFEWLLQLYDQRWQASEWSKLQRE